MMEWVLAIKMDERTDKRKGILMVYLMGRKMGQKKECWRVK